MHSTKETRALAYDVLAYWERFEGSQNQDMWVGDVRGEIVTTKVVNGTTVNVCNTTMCAAGTAVFLGMPLKVFLEKTKGISGDHRSWQELGAELLGLTVEESDVVFYSDNKSARRFMRAIASGSQAKFDKALNKTRGIDY